MPTSLREQGGIRRGVAKVFPTGVAEIVSRVPRILEFSDSEMILLGEQSQFARIDLSVIHFQLYASVSGFKECVASLQSDVLLICLASAVGCRLPLTEATDERHPHPI